MCKNVHRIPCYIAFDLVENVYWEGTQKAPRHRTRQLPKDARFSNPSTVLPRFQAVYCSSIYSCIVPTSLFIHILCQWQCKDQQRGWKIRIKTPFSFWESGPREFGDGKRVDGAEHSFCQLPHRSAQDTYGLFGDSPRPSENLF